MRKIKMMVLTIEVAVFVMVPKNEKKETWGTGKQNWFGLVWFYDISIIVGYLMPNQFLFI